MALRNTRADAFRRIRTVAVKAIGIIGSISLVTSQADAQVRIDLGGQVMEVPAGILRTIVDDGSGRRIMDRPWNHPTTPGVATITTTETTETDRRGRVLSRIHETRIEPGLSPYARPVGIDARSTADRAMPPAPPPILPPPAIDPDTSVSGGRAVDAEPRIIRIRRGGWAGHFVTTIRINGVAIKAIIDTGASSTILTPEAARQVGADRSIVDSQTGFGIGGATSLAITRLGSLEIGDRNLGAITVLIGQSGIPYTLLGQPEIARLGRIVIEDDVMTITPRSARAGRRTTRADSITTG